MVTFLFGISGSEFILVILVVLLLFGSKKIPDFARMLGKGMNEFRRATDEIKREFRENTEDLNEEITDSRQYLDKEMSAINDKFKEEVKDLDPYNLEQEDDKSANPNAISIPESSDDNAEQDRDAGNSSDDKKKID